MLAAVVMVIMATGTEVAQAGSVLPAPQLLPAAAVVTRVARTLFPVSGLATVTENVTVAAAPGVRLPAQARSGLANATEPAVAAASPS